MKKHLIRTVIPEQSEAWHEYRLQTIGASEIGACLGIDKWKWRGQLFLEKIGMREPWKGGNKATVLGSLKEDIVAQLWGLADPTEPDSYVDNYVKGNKVREYRNYVGSYVNPAYPHLSTSLDRVIKKGQPNYFGEILETEAPLELKTINIFAMKSYKHGIPPQYIAQVQQQMLITETKYGELCMLDSENNLHLYPIEWNDDLANDIIEKSTQFWELVKEGRELVAELHLAQQERDISKEEKLLAALDDLTPLPLPGEEDQYKKFLDETYDKSQENKILGDNDLLQAAKKIKDIEAVMSYLDAQKVANQNLIKEVMEDNDQMTFENSSDGTVTWREGKRGRTFRNNVKHTPDIDLLKQLAEGVIEKL
jgi:predicted phage-related endonuclease